MHFQYKNILDITKYQNPIQAKFQLHDLIIRLAGDQHYYCLKNLENAEMIADFINETISISLRMKNEKGTLRAVNDLIDSSNISEGDEDYKAVYKTVNAINKEEAVELYSGSASGNNTAATLLGFYDLKNAELSVFASTNCGSDD